MCETAQRSLYSSEHYGYVGKQFFENLRVDYRRIFRSAVVAAVRTVGVFRAQTAAGGILVYHGVHASRCDAEEQTGTPEFAEVAEISVPVGLWHYCHAIAGCF